MQRFFRKFYKKYIKKTIRFNANLIVQHTAPITLSILAIIVLSSVAGLVLFSNIFSEQYTRASTINISPVNSSIIKDSSAPHSNTVSLDVAAYDKKLLALAHYSATFSTTTVRQWPVQTVYPNGGALLPFNRIVAYYGNLYSKQMGVLGQYPEQEMFRRLDSEIKKWQSADPSTPVIPALDYIAITAQGSPGSDGKYRFRMPSSQLDLIIKMATKINAIVFLDIQVGLSTVQTEVPLLEQYLKMPQVHLALDPEFSMKSGNKPGTVIGTMDAKDVNYAAKYLAKLVVDNNLPPKILVVHRFTAPMLTHYKQIKPLPEVQVVMDMDGWGSQAKKIGTYNAFISKEPVQFTGFKLFYKNDFRQKNSRILTPSEVLKLTPQPSFIQYQ